MPAQFCTFALDGHLFGVPVNAVQEVLKQQVTTPVPLAAPEICGLLNLRGQIVTVVDLRVKLGLPARSSERAINVVVRTAEGVVSLLVDQIGDVLEPAESSFEAPPDTVPASVRALISAVCKLDDRLMLVLDTELAVTTRQVA